MPATFYWYAWVMAIIVFFFIQRRPLRYNLMFLTGIAMSTYSLTSLSDAWHVYIHVILLFFFGTHIWVQRKRGLFQHFWPFVLSLGYAAALMFLVVHPVWGQFPGMSLGLILIILFFRMILTDIEAVIGGWLLVNAGGTLWSYGIFAIYSNEGLIESQSMMTFVLKGLVVLFVFHGVDNLKRAIRRKRLKSTSKGAALV